MYLKRLELQGFKSFADKTVLEFKPGITAVIGPNGSGKSNISDSIRWVLGEQSMKSLRSAKAEDVIFAGTQNRKSLGFAEASIVIDNSDGKLPIEYNEVTVTRKLYRSGETGYFINKTPCRLKDIIELFMDTGIGKDGYSIIGQGKIDEILSNKSDDRRHIFEEAAGIVKYRTRKVESEKKLEQTKLNLLRINDILSEIEGQLDPLKLQADKARKFLDLREELKSIEVGLFVYNINTYKEKLEQIIEDLQILKDQETSESQKLEEGQNKKDTLKARIDELIAEIENMQNVGFESKTKIEQLNSQINVSKERISNNATNIERLTKEIEELHQRINDFNEEKNSKVSKKDNLFKNKERFETELKEKEEELAKISAKLSEKELEIEGKKKQVEADTDAKYERLAEINTYEINYENLEKTKKNVKQELQSTISELDSNRIKKQEISKNFQEIEATRNKAVKTLTEIKAQKEEALAIIKDFDEKINKLTAEYRMKDSRCKFLIETERDKDGYMKSVKSLLLACEQNSELNAGVEGVLASLISVDKKYETAIEMCLGQAMQNIVTKTETDAKKLIEHLRKNNLGRASFLPISSVHGKKIEKVNSNGIDGVIGIAADLVKADKKYQDIILNLLGRTVIVENMDSAIKLAKANSYSFRIVTLEGDVINPSGAISGGSVAQKTVNILGRSREIEELKAKLEELNSEIKKLEKEKEEHSVKIADTIEESARLEKNLQEIEITYATKKQELDMIDSQIIKLEEKMAKLKNQVEEIDEEKKKLEVSKEGTKQVIANLDKEMQELNAEITQFAELNKDDQTYIDNLNTDITDLKISVSSFDESGTSLDEMIARIEQDIQNAKAIKNISAETRFALTGTPIENSLSELWSIFDFIMPGYLFGYRKFKELYETPIIKEGNEVAMNKLKKLIEPFVLRRIKGEVLTELPDKMISVLNSQMVDEQRDIYLSYLAKAKKNAMEEIQENGIEKSQIKILALLTRLRQICCHPSLFIDNYKGESGKLNQCIEIVKDAIQSGHKILLFSGYTAMFEIIEKELQKENIEFLKLTGQTKVSERINLVDEFNSNPNKKLFLISLKAGGTGLNLVGADVVIHYDPWWNLSAENQATDRTYRIGQKRNVQVYKLITKNSIEEKIYELQKRKETLIDSMLSTNQTFISKLSKEDIMNLFE